MNMPADKGSSRFENHNRVETPGGRWSEPQGVHIPEPTYMPVVMAVGVVCMLWGIVTTPLLSLVGGILFVISIWGWIGELRHEHRHPGAE